MAGIRWYEIRSPNGSPVIFQQGTFSPGGRRHPPLDGQHRHGRAGNMALGYSVSDGVTDFPSVRYTGRLVGDPLGQMPQGEGVDRQRHRRPADQQLTAGATTPR